MLFAAFSLLLMVFPSRLSAQSVSLIRRFSTINGTVDFLPGAWVNVWENGRSTYYRFQDGRFVQAPRLPDLIRRWRSFGWGSVDFLNQIAIQNYDPGIDQLLPKQKRVKKVEETPLPAHGEDLVLACYTQETTEQFAEPGDTDIYLSALLGKKGSSGTTYKLLWTRKIETDASYGDLELQEIPGLGRFVVLYWGDMGGSGGQDALDVYRLTK